MRKKKLFSQFATDGDSGFKQAPVAIITQANVFGASSFDKYSWEGVFASIDKGTYATDYAIGDCVPLDLGSEGLINMQIVAFDEDDLADGRGKAPITWIAVELLRTERAVHTDGVFVKWNETTLYSYFNTTIKQMLPDNLQERISNVSKTTNSSSGTYTCDCNFWIPDLGEIAQYGSKPAIYRPIYSSSDKTTRIKKRNGSPKNWWTRTIFDDGRACYIKSSGADTNHSCGSALGICLCFCT